ncbi:MAG: hypothetical protein MPEBLZ_01548 [Candidatus Methanoperedens nitroreducens]|uniref:Uncharacterized protein n=2 Tax=Candidatus Methanoperedens TaxID=1392997 RepID=A0A0P7ZJC5_9EURY|nr:MAG: hypothetical protein MPEBLZ_01548 [Candidatus Methanoperedens sp. BLZ1]
MNDFTLYKYVEFLMFSSYLIFIFLLAQIWFLWKDVEKNEFVLKSLVKESFFKKNCIYIFLFSTFFMAHEFFEGLNIPGTMVFFELLDTIAMMTLVLFAYTWYIALKSCVPKKSITKEFVSE